MIQNSEPSQRVLHGYMTGPSIFDAVPSAAVSIVSVLDVSATIEHHWATILACLSGSEIETAMLLLEQLRTVSAQEKAILELARLKLDPHDALWLKAAAKALEPHRKRRNDFAHGVWAKPVSVEDQLVLLRGKHVRKVNAALAAFLIRGTYGDQDRLSLVIEERDIYGAAEFEQAVTEAASAAHIIRGITKLILTLCAAGSAWTEASSADEIRSELKENEGFKAALANQRPVAI